MQKRKPGEVALTTVSKVSLEQVHEKQSLEAPEMAAKKKTLTQSAKQPSARLRFVKKYKSLTA